ALLGRVVAAHRAGRPPARGIPVGYLARLLRAFDGGPGAPGLAPAAGAGVPGIIDPLTGREREVLAKLAARTSTQAITEALRGTLERVPRGGAVLVSVPRQNARQPHSGQAGRGHPHRGRRPGPATGPDPLAPIPSAPGTAPPAAKIPPGRYTFG